MRAGAEKATLAQKVLAELQQSGLLQGSEVEHALAGCRRIVHDYTKIQHELQMLQEAVSIIKTPFTDAEIYAFMHRKRTSQGPYNVTKLDNRDTLDTVRHACS